MIDIDKFKSLSYRGKCDVCGKEGDVVVLASAMGAVSFSYCFDCASNYREPYDAMVAYISCAGYWPDDINEAYQKLVRQNLSAIGKTEEEFAADVKRAIDVADRFCETSTGHPITEDEMYNVATAYCWSCENE